MTQRSYLGWVWGHLVSLQSELQRTVECQSQLDEDACLPEKSILSPLEVFPGWAEVAFGSLIYDLYKHP